MSIIDLNSPPGYFPPRNSYICHTPTGNPMPSHANYRNSKTIFSAVLYVLSVVVLVFWGHQRDFISIVLPYTASFATYAWLSFNTHLDRSEVILIALSVRLLGLFAFPQLSDDIYRYWWDGQCSLHGLNPFEFTPHQIMEQGLLSGEQFSRFYPLLNSPDYHSVYPSVCQFLFWLCAWISGHHIYTFSILLKLFFLIAEVSVLLLCSKTITESLSPQGFIKLYLLNPLLVVECYGNLHFEFLLTIFLLCALHLYNPFRPLAHGLAMGLSVISKIYSAIFLPLFLIRKKNQYFVSFLAITLCTLSMLVFINIEKKTGGGYGLYFSQFEFNSSIYILLSKLLIFLRLPELWKWRGMIMLFLFLSFYLLIMYRNYKSELSIYREMTFIYLLFIILNPTVHPWYLVPLSLFGWQHLPLTTLASQYMSCYSYIHYDKMLQPGFEIIRILEYTIILLFFLYEIKKRTPV